MNTNGVVVAVELPCGISQCDMNLLQRCEGKVLFLRNVRARVPMSDVDYSSYITGGVEPDTLTLMASFRVRFPAVICKVEAGEIKAVALGVGQLPAGVALQNSGPFDICNGDSICFLPSMFDCVCNRLRLESIDVDLIFPATVPAPIYGEVVGKVIARAVECIAEGRVTGPDCARPVQRPFKDADAVTYNGRRYLVNPCIKRLDALEPCVRNLALNVMFSITEGTMLILAMVPHLLTLGADDGYVNTLIGLESATRTAGQLIQMPRQQPFEDENRRFPLYECLAAWMQMAQYLGETLAAKPFLKACTFEGPSSAKPGEIIPVIANWF